MAAPRNGIVEIAGPERAPFYIIVARYLKAIGNSRDVVSDPRGTILGGRVGSVRWCPWARPFGRMGLDEWLRRSRTAA